MPTAVRINANVVVYPPKKRYKISFNKLKTKWRITTNVSEWLYS